MLPAPNRLAESSDFRDAVRRGRRIGSATLVIHLLATSDRGKLVGFVVSKAVGNAVVRNRVKRRLRHVAREHLSELPGSCVLVVRALPAAGEASYAGLSSDLNSCLARAVR